MWKLQAKVPLECSTSQFQQAIGVWIAKPHTVNRRLVGAKLVFKDVVLTCPYLECQFDEWISLLIDKLKSCNQTETIEKCAKEFSPGIPEFTDSTMKSKNVECVLRELIPKQLGRFHSCVELIIKDTTDCDFVFVPLVHKDENDAIVHIDNTMGYRVKYVPAEKYLYAYVTTKFEEPPCTSQGISTNWLESIFIPKVINWSNVKDGLNVDVKSLKLVPVDKYTLLYQDLKEKHGKKLVENWPESTDPRKYVYEDVAIAAYLILLWEETRKAQQTDEKQNFVDLGCGNGLLVYLLGLEGYKGYGIDIRKRNIWDMFGPDTCLQEDSITPEKLFVKDVWLIGNHSDELTPWIPVMATRSQCNFFVLPCCTWDFTAKFNAKCSGISQYRAYLNYVTDIVEVCGFKVEEDTLRIPSTKRVCFIGRSKTYEQTNWSVIKENINGFIENRGSMYSSSKVTHLQNEYHAIAKDETNIDQQQCNNCGNKKRKRTEYEEGNKSSTENYKRSPEFQTFIDCESDTIYEGGASSSSSKDVTCDICHCDQNINIPHVKNGEMKSFKPREYESEKKSHCLTIDEGVKGFIVKKVFEALLSKTAKQTLEAEDMKSEWNRGGTMLLSEVVALFDASMLQKLKSECGGIQTLLRNHHHIFLVQGGIVQLRNWTDSNEHDQYQTLKKKRKGQNLKNSAKDKKLLEKTKLCYFYDHHPDGCPLPASCCRFAHGEEDLKPKLL